VLGVTLAVSDCQAEPSQILVSNLFNSSKTKEVLQEEWDRITIEEINGIISSLLNGENKYHS
jgi:hypothetical protein